MKLSVVINVVANEIKHLDRLLPSVEKLADEIVIVDMTEGSSELKKLMKKYKLSVYPHKKLPIVEPARQYGIEKAKGEWILILDPDERVSQSLAEKINDAINADKINYYGIPRKNIIFGKWIKNARWWPDYNIRLFQKGHVEWSEVIHSVPITNGKGADFEIDEASAIEHYHYETIEQFIERLNRYTTEQAKHISDTDYKFKWHDVIRKPSGEFFSRYFFGQAYKEGLHGLALSLLQAFSELIVYLKLWQSNHFEEKEIKPIKVAREFANIQKDLNYWKADMLVHEKGGIVNRVKRKYKLP